MENCRIQNNVDTKWLNLTLMYIQFSVLYLKVPVTHVCELFEHDNEEILEFESTNLPAVLMSITENPSFFFFPLGTVIGYHVLMV